MAGKVSVRTAIHLPITYSGRLRWSAATMLDLQVNFARRLSKDCRRPSEHLLNCFVKDMECLRIILKRTFGCS